MTLAPPIYDLDQLPTMLEQVNRLSLDSVAITLREEYGLSEFEVAESITAYSHLLALYALYPHQHIVPTPEIDRVWHIHILDTAKYRADCYQIFGRILDHNPNFGKGGPEDAQLLQESFQRTYEMWRDHFGVAPYGTQVGAHCDDCAGDASLN